MYGWPGNKEWRTPRRRPSVRWQLTIGLYVASLPIWDVQLPGFTLLHSPRSVCLSLFRCIVVPHLTMPLTDCSHQNRVAYNLCVQLGEERLSCWNIMLQHSHIKLHSPHLQKCFNYPKWMVQELINLNIHTRVHLHCNHPLLLLLLLPGDQQ